MINWMHKHSYLYRAFLANRLNYRRKKWIKKGLDRGYFTLHSMEMHRFFFKSYEMHKYMPWINPYSYRLDMKAIEKKVLEDEKRWNERKLNK